MNGDGQGLLQSHKANTSVYGSISMALFGENIREFIKLGAGHGKVKKLKGNLQLSLDVPRFCWCKNQSTRNTESMCVLCDSCKEWQHCLCSGISLEEANSIRRFTCLGCRGNTLPPLFVTPTSVRSKKRLDGSRVSSNSDDDSCLPDVKGNEDSVAEFMHRSRETSQSSLDEEYCSQSSDEKRADSETNLNGDPDADLVFTSDEEHDESEEHSDDKNAEDSSSSHENEHEEAEKYPIETYSKPKQKADSGDTVDVSQVPQLVQPGDIFAGSFLRMYTECKGKKFGCTAKYSVTLRQPPDVCKENFTFIVRQFQNTKKHDICRVLIIRIRSYIKNYVVVDSVCMKMHYLK
ncbi:unnamed protein product [Allacma fusca]|uniref:Zinc finger PHD-type domain-containing protein n=1 Tax=Allacma fusca TaxID=39272 RepID=A0A8J2NJ56_9HEXA|nr:unnamed protein product [Allacma fusca]